MSLKVGIVGLPNAGKSTLFNALITKQKAVVAAHPFTTIDKNIGVVEVPDKTLFKLAKIENIDKVRPTTITFIDIAGLIKGAHQGEGLGNQFLHHIREVDLILHLVRFFKNEDIPHVHPKIDPKEDMDVVNEELLFADLETLKRRLERPASVPSDSGLRRGEEEKIVLKKFVERLNQGIPASEVDVDEKEMEFIKQLNLLTNKRQLLVANVGEEEINQPAKEIEGKPVLSISAKFEAELNDLPWVEQQQFLKTYGLTKSAKEKIILACYQALDIITFYTVAKKTEARAWTIKKGLTALEAAGKIHTDFAKHFIKAEVISAQELIKLGSWHKAFEAGKINIHGKDYPVQDQDVVEFKVALKVI